MFRSRFPVLRQLSRTQVRDLFRFATRRLNEEHLPQVAASLTFTTVLALVPLLTIGLAIFTAFPLFNSFRASLDAYFVQSLMPKAIASTILTSMNQFAANSSKLSAIGAIFLFVTAVSMMYTIDDVFNRIWQVKSRRRVSRRIVVYWAMITLAPLLIGISISMTTTLVNATSALAINLPFVSLIFYTVSSIVVTTGAFTLLYVAVPNRQVDWRDAVWGALLAALAFEIAKRLFALYLTKFPSYTMVYGALAAVPIFLLWLYIFWMITLFGALYAAALPVIKYERWWHVPSPGSAFVDAMTVLKVLYEARIAGHSAAIDANMIRNRTRLGFDESETLLQTMLDAGWVGRMKADAPQRFDWGKRISENTDCWTLLINPTQLKVADVYRLFVFSITDNMALARDVESAIEGGLNETIDAHFSKTLPDPSTSASTSSSPP
ncbi:YihY family inner membrane protein [soil metagenome]